ncbi:MAG: NAD(+)/NADH kinase [Clostridiales bacterium]|jgi:NAD+ kinase|nr:NAD(+)/NADH kinase [Clostridiales bacterium]
MTIGVYSNIYRDCGLKVTGAFLRVLKKSGIKFLVSDFPEFNGGKNITKEELSKLSDVIVVFGGDGTILSIVKNAAKEGIPVLGVNTGNLGFLTETDVTGLEEVADALKRRAFEIEERALIEARTDGGVYLALNEIVIREVSSKMAHIRLFVGESLLDEFYADGVLVSTPTGSTAYSLSAGGPILAPDVGAFIINPVNPHSLHSRPFVVSDNSLIKAETFKNDKLQLVADGAAPALIPTDGCAVIKKSDIRAKFVRIKPYDFYTKILYKFNKNV